MKTKFRVAIGLAFCAILGQLSAQNPTATLVGTVTDPTGGVVGAAAVEVRNSGTNEVRKAESYQQGEFTVPNLAPGIYEVSISKAGFRTLRETGWSSSWNSRPAWKITPIRFGVAAVRW